MGAPDGRGAAAGAPPALPCLLSNNSIELDREAVQILGRKVWRSAYVLLLSVAQLAKLYGLERLGFLTLTFGDHVTDLREAQRRFNSLASNVLSKRYVRWLVAVERQKSGRVHFHVLVVELEDIRTGVDFAAFDRGDYRSANRALRGEWAFWRGTAGRYRFGRTELLPVKSTTEAIGRYVGKYLAKHMGARREDDKGARLVRYSKGARCGNTRISGVGPKSWEWRKKLAKFAAGLGFTEHDDFVEWARAKYGRRWAYHLAGLVASEELAVSVSGDEGTRTPLTLAGSSAPLRLLPWPIRAGVVDREYWDFRHQVELVSKRMSVPL